MILVLNTCYSIRERSRSRNRAGQLATQVDICPIPGRFRFIGPYLNQVYQQDNTAPNSTHEEFDHHQLPKKFFVHYFFTSAFPSCSSYYALPLSVQLNLLSIRNAVDPLGYPKEHDMWDDKLLYYRSHCPREKSEVMLYDGSLK